MKETVEVCGGAYSPHSIISKYLAKETNVSERQGLKEKDAPYLEQGAYLQGRIECRPKNRGWIKTK
jgi:hypothetical protein